MILDKDIHYLKTNFLRGRTRPLILISIESINGHNIELIILNLKK